jgi:multidrug efflux system outer membrane protein
MLTLTSDVASSYFLLRAYDAEVTALRQTNDLRTRSLGLIEQRFKAGTIPEVDLARARTELATGKAELADVKRLRQETADILAILCGEPASTFTIAERPISGSPPGVPAGIPAEVLERRPDVAAAERLVAARNAEVGVATSYYFPSIKLTGDAGFLSLKSSSLFSADSKVWSIGPEISLPLTGYVLIGSRVRQAKAAREEAIANYRQAVLGAVKDVETSLTQIRSRREQAAAQSEALAAATQSTALIRSLYESGSLSYLELLDAERTLLQLQRQSAQITAQRFAATVRLIKAMGGGW